MVYLDCYALPRISNKNPWQWWERSKSERPGTVLHQPEKFSVMSTAHSFREADLGQMTQLLQIMDKELKTVSNTQLAVSAGLMNKRIKWEKEMKIWSLPSFPQWSLCLTPVVPCLRRRFSSFQSLSHVWLFATFPVHHQLPELTQTSVHQVSDAIQPSHPLSSPSSPAFNLSQQQSLFQWVSS